MPNLHVIAAGSLLEFAIAKVGVPVGRISMLYMYPISFIEYLVATNNHLIGKEILEHPIGLPMEETIHKKILDLLGEYLSIVGLCQSILGSDISVWFLRPLEGFKNRGEIAEGFIGQELICYASPHSKAQIHFWKRKEKNSHAEIDYLIQRDKNILPIEVKSGHSNTLRSLHLFLDTHPECTSAIRFSSLNYSLNDIIDSRPLYSAASLAHASQQEALHDLVIPHESHE